LPNTISEPQSSHASGQWPLHLTARGVDGCRVGAGKEKKHDERRRENARVGTRVIGASCEGVQVRYTLRTAGHGGSFLRAPD